MGIKLASKRNDSDELNQLVVVFEGLGAESKEIVFDFDGPIDKASAAMLGSVIGSIAALDVMRRVGLITIEDMMATAAGIDAGG